jgi:aminopeptidase YwaD
MWPRGEERGKVTWGFNVSRDTADRLKKLLTKKKKVLLSAVIKGGELFDSDLEIVNASITGADLASEEVLLMAHLCHPKPAAEDNASGSAAICDIACAISELISKKGAKRPRRTLRFLWVPEMYGTMAYVSHHRSLARQTLACINCDMVGADPKLTDSQLHMSTAPDSLPSFLGDLLDEAAKWVRDKAPGAKSGPKYPFKYRIVPYSLGSDDFIFTDSTVGVYSTMLNRWPNTFHHTHKDTPEIVNPTELLRSSIVAALTALTIADAGPKQARAMLAIVRKKGDARLGKIRREADKTIAESKRSTFAADYTLQLKRLYSGYRREVASAQSVLRLSGDDALKDEVSKIEGSLWDKCDAAIGRAKGDGEAQAKKVHAGFPPKWDQSRDQRLAERMVPRREVLGPVCEDYLRDHLPQKMLDWGELSKPEAGAIRYEAVNFINGQRNVLAIHDLLEGEYGACDLAGLIEYIRALERARLISVRRG